MDRACNSALLHVDHEVLDLSELLSLTVHDFIAHHSVHRHDALRPTAFVVSRSCHDSSFRGIVIADHGIRAASGLLPALVGPKADYSGLGPEVPEAPGPVQVLPLVGQELQCLIVRDFDKLADEGQIP